MIKYVWFNLNTGEFSNSWTEEEHRRWIESGVGLKDSDFYPGWKLIKYECLNDDSFMFVNLMRVVTNDLRKKRKRK